MRLAFLLLLAPSLARADVNLLTSAPTTVAVSSTVDNAAILPEHLVDGKLDTAWNSRTGDLGAWIAVRVPKTAHVTKLRLTAGFTKGDFFTQNHRIKRIGVWRDGKELGTFALDLERRDLQDVAIGADGGDFTIRILESVAGTKPGWREIAISELEVWGTIDAPKPQKPVVRVGSLDVDCAKLLFPGVKANRIAADDLVLETEVVRLGDRMICRVEHGTAESGTVEIALVGAKVIEQLPSFPVSKHDDPNNMAGDSETVAATPLALGDQAVLRVDETTNRTGPMLNAGGTRSTLYRATKTGLDPILSFKSHWDQGESEDSERCEVAVAGDRKPLPDLDLTCTQIEGRWHGEDPRGNGLFETPTTKHYRWKGGRYLPR